MIRLKVKRGQGTLEYVLLFGAVVLVIAGIIWGVIQRSTTAVFNSAESVITDAAADFNLEP